jgi:hypothetical protein
LKTPSKNIQSSEKSLAQPANGYLGLIAERSAHDSANQSQSSRHALSITAQPRHGIKRLRRHVQEAQTWR